MRTSNVALKMTGFAFALLSACAGVSSDDMGRGAEAFDEDGGVYDKGKNDGANAGATPTDIVGLSANSGLVQGLLVQPYSASTGALRAVGFPLRARNVDASSLSQALASAGYTASSFRSYELLGYFAIRSAGTFLFALQNNNAAGVATLKVDTNRDGVPDTYDPKNGVSLGVGAHAFSLTITTSGEAPSLKKAEVSLKTGSKAKVSPLPDALFARKPDVSCTSTCGAGKVINQNGKLPSGLACTAAAQRSVVNQAACTAAQSEFAACCVPGTGGDTTTKPAWCIGEDTTERAYVPPTTHCDICGGREFKSANWAKGKGCIEAYSTVSNKATASAECQAVIANKRDFCCDGFYEAPARVQCTGKKGPYAPVDLCDDGCFPSSPATAGVYSLQAGGPLAPWVSALGNRVGTCYQDDASSPNALVWSCRRAYYLLKYGWLPAAQAHEVISWWSGHHSLSANCGCDAENSKNPAN